LRGDSKARAEFYKALFNMGAISIDELRGFEDMNPIGGDAGQARYMQINMGKINIDGTITGGKNEITQQDDAAGENQSES
jgi:hypothetical protein